MAISSSRRQVAIAAAVVPSYLLLACLVYLPVAPWSSSHMVHCACADPVQEVWYLRWTAWAVVHGHNPFFSYYMNAPHGVNLAINTSFPLLGILATPFTQLIGPIAVYNLLLRLALGLSAASMYWLLRRYTTWRPAAYAGGLLYGFNPYMMGHAREHVFLTFVALLPLFVMVVDDWLVRPRRNPYLSGAFLGLLTAAQFMISPEIAALMIIVLVAGLVPLAVRHRQVVRERLSMLWRGVAPAVGVTALAAGLPAYVFLFGKQRPVGALHNLHNLEGFRGDLAAPLFPTHGQLIHVSNVGAHLVKHSVYENGFYLGLPLVLFLGYAIARYRRNDVVLATAIAGLVAFVLSLGTKLDVNGHQVLPVMPFSILRAIPLLQNIEPARLSLFVQMAAAVLSAIGLDLLRAERLQPSRDTQATTRRRSAFVAAVVVIALVPLVPRLPLEFGRVHVPALFRSDAVKTIPQGSLALTYPYTRSPMNDAMLWQAASDMRFRIIGADAFVPGVAGRSTWVPDPPYPPNIKPLMLVGVKYPASALQRPKLPANARMFLSRYHVGIVLVDPSAVYAPAVTRVLTEAIGIAPTRIGGMDVWRDVPELLKASAHRT